MKFTDRSIAKLSLPEKGRKDYFRFDDGMPNLAVRVGVGSKRFVFQARDGNGGQLRQTLGKFPAVTVAQARKHVKVLAGKVAKGDDLREEKTARRAKRDRARADAALTLAALIDSWEGAHRPKRQPSYVKGTADGLRRVYKRLLDRPAASIAAEELEAGWESLVDQPAAAHIAGVRMRTLFGWAVKTRKLEGDPTKRMVLAEKTGCRDRELSGAEARLVWKAAGTLPRPYGAYVRFLMATGLRLREAAGARRGGLNDDSSELTFSAPQMKAKLKHVVPLPPIVRRMLAELPQFQGSDLFFTRDGKRPIAGFSDLKQRLDEALAGENLAPWTFHDFRRSLVGWLVRHGVDSLVADKLLAHSRTSKLNAVAAVYNHYDFLKERAEALQLWADFLVGEEVETSASAPLMLSAPSPALSAEEGEKAAPQTVFQLTGVKKQEEALEERFADLILRITSRPDVIRANFQILKRNDFAPEFLATLKHKSAPYGTAIAVLTYTAALAHQEEITVFKPGEVEAQRDKLARQPQRWHAEAERARLEAEQARAIGQQEFAAKADAQAQKAEAIAGLWERVLQNTMTPDDVCVVTYRKDDPRLKESRARGVFNTVLLLTETIFGAPEPGIAAAYATAATGVEMSRWRASQPIRDGKVGSPKRAAR